MLAGRVVGGCRGLKELEVQYGFRDLWEPVNNELLAREGMAAALRGHNLRSFTVEGDAINLHLPYEML